MEVLAIGWSRVTKLKENPVSAAFEVARRGSTFFGIENFVLTKWRSLYLYVARCHTLFKCRAAHTLVLRYASNSHVWPFASSETNAEAPTAGQAATAK